MKKDLEKDQAFKNQRLAKTRDRRQRLAASRDRVESLALGGRNDLLPELTIQTIEISGLKSSLRHVRRISAAHVERVASSIADLGFTQPILVRHSEIVDGHTRVEAAKRLGLDHVPAIEVAHLSDPEVRKLRLALNRTAELGEWDLDQLRIEVADLNDLEVDLTSTGFSPQELDIILLDDDDGDPDKESLPEPSVHPVTESGDLWLLGEHRVLCGNALEKTSYARLLGDDAVHAVLTDPPYNVPVAGHVSGLGKKTHAEFAMASGEMSEAEWQTFLDSVLGLLSEPLIDGGVMFAFMDWRSIHRLYAAGLAAGLNLANLVVWYKEAGSMGSLYRSAHELVAVFCKGRTPRINNVELGRYGRDRSNVWVAPGANRPGSSANAMLAFHATPKPVELCVDAILDVTERGDTVLDAFLGSGTTLVAADKAGRRCCGIEIEPRFVDVILRRWQQLTGREAVLAETGETFSKVEVRRAEVMDRSQQEVDHV
jgi:DNA modification methylase